MNTIKFILVVSMVLLASNLIYPLVVNGQEYNQTTLPLSRIIQLEDYCTISEIGVGDDYQPNATVILKNEFTCKELVNYRLSTLVNSSIVFQDSNQIVINLPKNITELNQSIEHRTWRKKPLFRGGKIMEFRLGRSIATIVPFQVTKKIVEQKDKIPFKMIILISLVILIIKIVVIALF